MCFLYGALLAFSKAVGWGHPPRRPHGAEHSKYGLRLARVAGPAARTGLRGQWRGSLGATLWRVSVLASGRR